jgi:small GTP-binding protein
MTDYDYDYKFKIMIFGEKSSQKTSLINRYFYSFYAEDLKLTIGVDFYSKTVNFEEEKVKMQIWDFGGEERFRFLLSQYCKGADGAIFLYDITNRNTLNHLSEWIQIMRENAGNIPIILAGTNLDLEDSRNISYAEGLQVSRDYDLNGFMEVSSKTGENVEKLFNMVLHSLLQNYT